MGRIGGRSYVIRCHVCRRRKVKCDGQKPSCERCMKTGLVCTGYERELEFAYFHGQSEPTHENCQSGTNALSDISRVSQAPLGLRRQHPGMGTHFPVLPFSFGGLTAFQYKAGFVAILQDRYVPNVPKFSSRSESMCEGWIATACDLSSFEDSDMLSNSLLAMALTFAGAERKDSEISAASMRHYSRALVGLRTGLEFGPRSLNEYQIDTSLITCLACAMYEMTSNKSFTALLRHLQGVGAVLRDRGVENLRSPTSRLVFWEYRAMEITIALITRRSSFLSLPEWLNPPWRHLDSHGNSHLQTLIDIAIQLPNLMERFDGFKHSVEHGRSFKPDVSQELLAETLNIQLLLACWESSLRGGDKKSQLYIARLANHPIPRTTGKADESGNVFPISYNFPGFNIGSALMFYEATQIYLYGFLRDMSEFFQHIEPTVEKPGNGKQFPSVQSMVSKSLECADRICQSVNYFFEPNKRIIGRVVIMFPFESARALLAGMAEARTGDEKQDNILRQKLQFCNTVAQRFKDEGLPTWDR